MKLAAETAHHWQIIRKLQDMSETRYIQVILPVPLDWEPLYSYEYDGDPAEAIPVGARVRVRFGSKPHVGVVSCADAAEAAAQVGPSRIRPIDGRADDLDDVSEEEIALWRKVASYYLCSVGEVFKAAYPSLKVSQEETRARARARKAEAEEKNARKAEAKVAQLEQRLEKKEAALTAAKKDTVIARLSVERDSIKDALEQARIGLKMVSGVRSYDDPVDTMLDVTGPSLSAAQTRALEEIRSLLLSRKPVLMHGVTGSGKTEIYLSLAAEALSQGRNVLILVPEITLSRQLEDRIRDLFPNHLQVFHSAETALSRCRTADFIRKKPYLVLGTRSAVFLPHRNLGLIVVDEEHDPSYKQDSPAPRYNGRETAIMLASIHSADVVLGSATPSLESLYNCSAGRFGKVNLSERYFNALDSDVEVVDTQAEWKKNGMVGSFSRKLISRISGCLDRGEQILLLRERRAYSPTLRCSSCGTVVQCTKCNAPLSLHHRSDGTGALVCHHCGRVHEYIGKCSKCGAGLVSIGAGTQKIEEEIRNLFPSARVARLDSDSAQEKNYAASVIRSFSKGETDILVGTQMVAKGLDFSGVTLVAVLSADSVLSQGDYRADERGLQLLEQFRGRCGRRGTKGLFVIQISNSEHPVCQTLDGSLKQEETMSRFLSERKMFGYPPYSREINVIVKDYIEERLERTAAGLAASLRRSGMSSSAKVIGPFPPPVDRVSGLFIRQIRVLLAKDRNLLTDKKTLKDAVDSFSRKEKCVGRISLDVDPV